MTSDPWKDLKPPTAANAVNARRVDIDTRWSFFWARGIDGKCQFLIQHAADSTPTARLPRLQGVEVTDAEWVDGRSRVLVFKLEDSAHRDLFYRLCVDITSCAADAPSEKEAVLLALARTWRWHHLLRGGGDKRLSPEEQKGLIGELLLLERHILPHLKCADAVGSWGGPLGAPKDFSVGQLCIEVKARRGAATPHVTVSSESQLDEGGVQALFLYVVDLDRAPADAAGSFNLSEVARRVRELIAASDQGSVETFEALLTSAGFRWSDDYSESLWIEGAHRTYQVHEDFPRIKGSELMGGVAQVRYNISLVECQPYQVDPETLDVSIRGVAHGE